MYKYKHTDRLCAVKHFSYVQEVPKNTNWKLDWTLDVSCLEG